MCSEAGPSHTLFVCTAVDEPSEMVNKCGGKQIHQTYEKALIKQTQTDRYTGDTRRFPT